MLKRFTVENYKGFEKTIVMDFKARDYSFSDALVKNGVVKNAIVYGRNGIGKSSLGSAIFDIIIHLTDVQPINEGYLQNYINLENIKAKFAKFTYLFELEGVEVEYSYQKLSPTELKSERLMIDGREVFFYDFYDLKSLRIDRDVVGNIDISLPDNRLSVAKFLYRNLPTNFIPGLTRMIRFCQGMLWFRSLSDGTTYAGFTNGARSISGSIAAQADIRDFQSFLRQNGLEYDLVKMSINGKPELFAEFAKGKRKVPFWSVASTGTKALTLFYFWKMISFRDITFLFIDEFDAFYHYESAEIVVKLLNKEMSFQTVLTSHNTYLMTNRLTRPDCCYIMTRDRLACLADCTDKELREAHNLEKIYVNGGFCG